MQIELQTLMDDDDVTIENIMAYKQGFHSVEEIEKTLVELVLKLHNCQMD